jgi:hypothetical protein
MRCDQSSQAAFPFGEYRSLGLAIPAFSRLPYHLLRVIQIFRNALSLLRALPSPKFDYRRFCLMPGVREHQPDQR